MNSNIYKNLINNFNELKNWEEKYIYLIELGYNLKKMPEKFCKEKYRVFGCQSKVWIKTILLNDKIKFYGHSDSSIVNGLIYLVFYFYKNMNANEILSFNIYNYIKKMSLNNHLTSSRSQGLKSIILYINKKVKSFTDV